MAPTGSPALMRAINAAEVVRNLRRNGPLSRADLVRATGLAKPTITNVVAYLEELAYIERVDNASNSRGAAAPRYAYRTNRGQVLGIDIGADKTLLLLADLAGNILGSTRFPTRAAAPKGPSQVLEQISWATEQLLAESGATRESLMCVVAGTPGVVSPEGVVQMAPQLEGWEGLDLRAALETLFDCPVAVHDEVALSLQAERWLGVAQGIDDALFVHLGIGVGASILVDGAIMRGADGGAGEIGLMPYPLSRPDGSMELIPLESLASGGALRRLGRELAKSASGAALLERAGRDPEAVDAALVFASAREGDPAAQGLIDQAAQILAWGISCLVCALNPRSVILGGGLTKSAEQFLPRLRDRVREAVPFVPEWFVSTLGDEAVALGAVDQATAIVERDLFGLFSAGAA